ncbi:coiled-coil domain-containing protein 112 [Anguilla anguilla]|uniref:coiled-coil domain-containing protein 112 n=1 Tax=Anguilla anguilla TaxID=7936 RepID=UPI0015ABEEC8|nr:coiled-coil domain-containing protein 112 [Anguilla anguilla]
MADLATAASGDALHDSGDGNDIRVAGHHGNQNRMEKASQGKKMQFLRTAENLRRQVDKLEKEKGLSNQSRNLFRDDSGTIEDLESKLTHDRTTEVTKLQQQLKKTRAGVTRFQRQLMDVKPTPELIEKLKEIMTEVENSIRTFKEDKHQSYEELLKREYTCWQEVCTLEKKIGAWALAGASGSKAPLAPPAHAAKVCLPNALPPEVNELERFLLLTGGRQGGWDQYDHEVFLRERGKRSGRDVLPHVPGKRGEEVVQHEEWYQRLLLLEEKKREAILKWRTQKERSREQELRRQKEEEEAARREEAELAEAQQRQEEEERREAAARLEAWKAERRAQEDTEREKQVREEVLHRKKAKEERRRQQEAKLALEAHMRARRQQQELLLMEREYQEQEEMEERQRAAAVGIKIFQERDLFRLEVKLQEKQIKEEEEAERQKRLAKMKEKVEAHVSRDPSRLCKPTQGWQERTKVVGPTGGGPVSQRFHRAVPSWRRDL